MSPQDMQEKIRVIQIELDHSNDTDPYYFHPVLKELRNYILQVHSTYEWSLDMIIMTEYLKLRPMAANSELFEQLTFDSKLKLIMPNAPTFPSNKARSLNTLRNEFVHKDGRYLQSKYPNIGSRLKLYQFLKKSNDTLNNYFETL